MVSTIGGTTKSPEADSQGNINIINAAAKKGVKKFILVTSIGCGDTKDAPGEQVYKVLEPVLVEKNKAEEALKVREWVICSKLCSDLSQICSKTWGAAIAVIVVMKSIEDGYGQRSLEVGQALYQCEAEM